MYSLLRRANRLINLLDPVDGISIIVFAVTQEDKLVEQELPKEWANLEYEPFIPDELPKELKNAVTLGELQKLCKKAGYGLDILPVKSLGDIWEDENI